MIRDVKFPDSVALWFGLTDPAQRAAKLSTVMSRAMPEVREIVRALPSMRPAHIVDIGCGLGAKTLALAWIYRIEYIYLLDGDGSREHKGGYQERTDAWTDVSLARDFLQANLSPDYKVQAINTNIWDKTAIPADLIVSFRSWGHHFSVREYLDFAWASLNPGGHVILDIRRNTDGFQLMLDRGFKMLMELNDPSSKCCRMVYTK